MRFVFLALLDRALVTFQVVVGFEALHLLLRKIAIRHRVADRDCLLAEVAQYVGDSTRHLALATASAHGRNRDNRFARTEHRGIDIEGREGNALCFDQLAPFLNVLEAHVRVGEDHLVDGLVVEQIFEFFLGEYRNAVRILRPGQFGRIFTVVNIRDLGRRERDNVDGRVIPIHGVEDVKIAPCGAHDDEFSAHDGPPIKTVSDVTGLNLCRG